MPELQAVDEQWVADRLGISLRNLQQMRYDDAGPPYVKLGRRVRYRPKDVDRW